MGKSGGYQSKSINHAKAAVVKVEDNATMHKETPLAWAVCKLAVVLAYGMANIAMAIRGQHDE